MLGLAGAVLGALLACKEEAPPPAPAPVPIATATGPCARGVSEDPTVGEFKPAQLAFNEKRYPDAKTALVGLATKYPHSASVRVWQGDAALYGSTKLIEAADESIVFYGQALKLHEQGCKLSEYEHYYLRAGFANAYLRKKDGKAALVHLRAAEKEFDDAGIYYHSARAHCRENDLDQCVAYFEKTLVTAKALRRPRFLRTHYSLASWISRSRTQSEFTKLRADKRYAALLKRFKDD